MPAKVLVVGVARNSSKTIQPTVRALENLFRGQAELTFFVVESDSSDKTSQVLSTLHAERKNEFEYLSLGDLAHSYPLRIQRIAYCRNIYLDHLRRLHSKGVNFEYVVVADFDGVNRRIKSNAPVLGLLNPQTVVTANQFTHYYDILALRKAGWVDEDYRVSIAKMVAANPKHRGSAFFRNVFMKQIKIKPSTKSISVQSAFGGLAIYPGQSLLTCAYKAQEVLGSVLECEHVSLNRDLRDLGYEIKIATGLRNSGSLGHTWGSFRLLSPIARLISFIRPPGN